MTRRGLDAATIRDGGPPAALPQLGVQPGAELAGRYRVLELLGVGGMGVVYRARDLALDIDVALKLLHPRIAHDPDKVAFFRDEVRIARRVTHPNVCRLHDLVDDPRGCFITMEHVAGEALSARLAHGRLELPIALRVLRDIASGLAAAHAAGVIHRDLKPSNVLLAIDRAVVADFGIAGDARALAAGQDAAGTRGYMAPEQATGAPIDARADVYALGVLAFAVTTGQRPPPAVTRTAGDSLRFLPLAATDQIRSALAGLPAALAALIADCLALAPHDRPRDAGDVLQRLDSLVLAPDDRPRDAAAALRRLDCLAPAHSLRAGAPRRAPWAVVAMCAITGGALVGTGVALAASDATAHRAAPQIALPPLDPGALAARDRRLAAMVQHLVREEAAWQLDIEIEVHGDPSPSAPVIGVLARDPSGRLRLVLGKLDDTCPTAPACLGERATGPTVAVAAHGWFDEALVSLSYR